jgi:hypothetical protein
MMLAVLSPMVGASAARQSSQDPVDAAVGFIQDNTLDFGVSRTDVSDLRVLSTYKSSHNGVTHVNLNQRRDGLEVFGGYATVNLKRDGSVLFVGETLVAGLDDASGTAELEAVEAVEAAADELELDDPADVDVIDESTGPAQRTIISSDISDEPIPARLGWQPTADGLRLAWQLIIDDSSDSHLWNATVDAETGELLDVADWTDHDTVEGIASGTARSVASSAASNRLAAGPLPPNQVNDGSSYRVYELPKESPNDGGRTLVSNPADATTSPFGWHDTDGAAGAEFTITRGNNAHAYLDQDDDEAADFGDTDGGAGLTFDFPVDLNEHAQNYRDAVVTNLFYWNNVFHDVMSGYGFDEASGNFQATNYSAAGTGGDYVRAEAADGSGTNNANFSTPAADGGTPRMQMYLWPGNQFGNQNQVVVDGLGSFGALWSRFGPSPTPAGTGGQLVLVNDGTALPTEGCSPLVGFPAGAIAVVDRGTCPFLDKVVNAEAAGASAVIIANNTDGNAPILTGSFVAPPPTIPAVSVNQTDGNAIKAALPANGTVRKHPNHPGIRDGDFDAGIIMHEYTHGISNRLTGGPGVNCLSGNERMSEGWSDWFANAVNLDPVLDDPEGARGMGPYALFQDDRHGNGIRPRPYSRTMEIQPFTYDRIKTNGWITGGSLAVPHGVGHAWASILWDMVWNLIDRHGFNPNVYESWDTGGKNLALQLVTDGLKLQGCAPGFVVGRDAIIAADEALTGGENSCIIWSTFARRGVGFSAVQGTSADRNDNTEAFDVPPSCAAPGTGFDPPVENSPALNTFAAAGETIPLKFNIGGDRGPNPLASQSPASQEIDCTTLLPVQYAITTPTESANNQGLKYVAAQQRYQYGWATDQDWAGTCRRVIITLDDGKQLTANFSFEKLVLRGKAPFPASFPGPVSSDLAFWGKTAFQGNFDGFRVIDISKPSDPEVLSHPSCFGDQGDIVVWKDILVRSWNSPAPAGAMCDGQPVPQGFEGFHVFDISDLSAPELVGSLELSARPEADAFGCGSHTATAVPDPDNDRLLIYNATSGGPCPFVGLVEVPLDDPGAIAHVKDIPLEEAGAAHDVGVILGDANLMAVASHDFANVFDISDPENPEFLYGIEEAGVCNEAGNPLCNGNWHSAGFTWDGEVIIMGWEPGGGLQAECEAGDPDVKKSWFFYDAETGAKLGQFVLPNSQGPDENCTIHNYNVVPVDGKYVLVGGNYQAGTWVVDFTDPANASTVAYVDPPSLGPGPFCSNTTPPGCQLGGVWSSYYYNQGFIYASDITKGLNIYRLRDHIIDGAVNLPHLNPQTQEFTLP